MIDNEQKTIMIFNLEKILQPAETNPLCEPYLFYESVYDVT